MKSVIRYARFEYLDPRPGPTYPRPDPIDPRSDPIDPLSEIPPPRDCSKNLEAPPESPRPPLGPRPLEALENGRRSVSPPTSKPPEASGDAIDQVLLAARSWENGQNVTFACSRALQHRESGDRHDPKPRPVHDRTSAIDPRSYARMACEPINCEAADFECTVTGAITG